MKPSTALMLKAVCGLLAAGVTAAAGASVAHQEHGDQLELLIRKVDGLAGDVRLLKCAADFPGDCPGQAKAPSRAR